MAKKIPGVCVARFKPLRQIWHSGYRLGFISTLGLVAFILLFMTAYLFFPAYVPEGSGRATSERIFYLSIPCLPLLVFGLINFVRSMRHDGIYVSTAGVRVIRRGYPPELIEAEKDSMFMNSREVHEAGTRARERARKISARSRLMCSPEISVLPTEKANRGRWCIAFRSQTQVLERVPMRWIGTDSEKAAQNMISRIQHPLRAV